MSALLVAVMFTAGFGMWVYAKLQRNTGGGNNKNALIGAGVAGVIGFIVVFSLFRMILPS